jgi:hypothetical protein
MDSQELRARKDLSADGLFSLIRGKLDRVPDPRSGSTEISLGDALMAAFAMFSLNCLSLLAFEGYRNKLNTQRIYHVGRIPSGLQTQAGAGQSDW